MTWFQVTAAVLFPFLAFGMWGDWRGTTTLSWFVRTPRRRRWTLVLDGMALVFLALDAAGVLTWKSVYGW